MSELLEWAEKLGLENLKFHLQTSEHLTKESNTTLTILLAGLGGSVAILTKLLEGSAQTWLIAGVIGFGLHMTVLSALLIRHCLKTDVLSAPTNEPRNLYQPDFSRDAIREVELSNMQVRIEQVVTRNNRVATWLDRLRMAAVFAPIVSVVVGSCTALVHACLG